MTVNLHPLREWYRQNAPHVQMDPLRWANGLSPHTLEDLELAVEQLDLPDGNLPTPALVNALLAEVREARSTVEERARSTKGFEAFKAERARMRGAA